DERLKLAIQENTLDVYFQPVISIQTGIVSSVEAFARWEDSQYGWISPSMFLRMAERQGKILELGLSVFEASCKNYLQFIPSGAKEPRLAVNLSTRQLSSTSYVYQLNEVCDRFGIPKEMIEFEITEENGSLYTGSVSDSIHLLHTLGYKIVLDDYGAYSTSLTSLLELHIDKIKIDGYFIKLVAEKKVSNVLKHLVDMCKELNLHVVLEGIENDELRDLALISGADMIQGNLILPPTSDFSEAVSVQPMISRS
ncbi:MAG: EAL domain-containing protein, partial [Spirochaetia bacterium]|nr:EAL domain-containing protein [Spirochaetia bacterium]